MTASYVTRAGPGGGTPQLHHKHTRYTDSMQRHKKRECVYDGAELGSTGLLRVKEITDKERSMHRETYANLSNFINANENFAPEAFTSLDMSMDRELLAA